MENWPGRWLRDCPNARFSARLERSGRTAISLGLSQILDRQGMMPAENFGCLRTLLACWTRCRALAAELPRAGWGPRCEQRYRRFVRNALRCTRPDGRPLFAEDGSFASDSKVWGRELFEAVLKSGVEESTASLRQLLCPPCRRGSPPIRRKMPPTLRPLRSIARNVRSPSCAATGIATTSGLRYSFPRGRARSNWLPPAGLPRPGLAIRDYPAGPATSAGIGLGIQLLV